MAKSFKPLLKHCGYSAGHPWYYVLGGDIPTLKQIQAQVIASGYRGYLAEDLRQIDSMSEPKRSEKLRNWQSVFRKDLKEDISQYRKMVRDLRQDCIDHVEQEKPTDCRDIHVSMSLKNSHLSNDFAHLHFLDELLGKQLDLFAL